MTIEEFPLLKIFLGFTAFMLFRYFAFAGAMYQVTMRTKRIPLTPKKFQETQTARDIKWSVISTLIFAASGTLLIYLWHTGRSALYYNIDDYGWIYFLVSLPLILIIQDTYFYWTHRLLHHRSLFNPYHLVHHQSRTPTAWTSFAFHPVEAALQAIILPVIFVLIPVHYAVLFTFLGVMTFFGVFNHLGYEFLPKALEAKFGVITATHHHFHHQRVDRNFGLFFTWWDRLMKTEGER
jgi:Delta7-sterol 5-desaturase